MDGHSDTATDTRVRLLLQTRQLPTNPRSSVGRETAGGPQGLAAAMLVMALVVVLTVLSGQDSYTSRKLLLSVTIPRQKGKGD